MPWRDSDSIYISFDGGLAPGESRRVQLVSWFADGFDPDLPYYGIVEITQVSGPDGEPTLDSRLEYLDKIELRMAESRIESAKEQLSKLSNKY